MRVQTGSAFARKNDHHRALTSLTRFSGSEEFTPVLWTF